jgi:hypothetical protein
MPAPAFDNYATAEAGSTSGSVTLSTSGSNDIVFVCYGSNSTSSPNRISSMSSPTLGSFTARFQSVVDYGHSYLEVWWAVANAPLSSEVISFTIGGSNFQGPILAAAFSGIDTGSPFDVNGGLPYSYSASGSGDIVLSTTGTNDVLFFCSTSADNTPDGPPSVPGTFSSIVSFSEASVGMKASYLVVATAQSGVSVPCSGGMIDYLDAGVYGAGGGGVIAPMDMRRNRTYLRR